MHVSYPGLDEFGWKCRRSANTRSGPPEFWPDGAERRGHDLRRLARLTRRRSTLISRGFSRHGLLVLDRNARVRALDAPPVMKAIRSTAAGATRSSST